MPNFQNAGHGPREGSPSNPLVTADRIAHRARGLARQATEDRERAERTLEVLRAKEAQACLEALQAEAAVLQVKAA